MISRDYFINDMLLKSMKKTKSSGTINKLMGHSVTYFGCVYDIMYDHNMTLHIINQPVFKLNNDIIKYTDGTIVSDDYGIHINYDDDDDTYFTNTNTFTSDIVLKKDYNEDEDRTDFFLKSLEDFDNRIDKDKDIYFYSIYIEQTIEYFKATFRYCQI